MTRIRKSAIIALLISFVVLISGCSAEPHNDSFQADRSVESIVLEEDYSVKSTSSEEEETEESSEQSTIASFSLEDIPAYSGEPYAVVNDNVPYFTEDDLTTESYEYYSTLDELSRCGYAMACIGIDLMPTEEREDISEVYPTGWEQNEYDFVDGGYLYNRCHLIGFQLSGENDNELNLITGTRYMNVEGMLPFENLVADYVEETSNHVLYRVTPVYDGDNLLASGVLLEAVSVEDDGEGLEFNVFCYNVQPGVEIDYTTGENWVSDSSSSESGEVDNDETNYILNTNSLKFHYPDCSSVSDMSEKNKSEYTGSRDELIEEGYEPCGRCNP